MKSIIISLSLSGFLFLTSCEDSGTEVVEVGSFTIYRLSDTTMLTSTARTIPLDSLALASSPFITSSQLTAYYWTTHSFIPVPALDTVLKRMSTSGGSVYGSPFVVMVGDERIYLGSFWWAYSSLMPSVPYIELITPGPYTIKAPPVPTGTDPREDPRVRASLRKAGILIE
jgi:hypothetical protein